MNETPTGRCLNCDDPLTGAYCSTCGQRTTEERLRTGRLLRETVAQVTNTDSTIWRTLAGLTLHPGRFAGEFVDGHRADRVRPLRYALVVTAFSVLAVTLIGPDWGEFALSNTRHLEPEQAQAVRDATQFMVEYLPAASLLSVPAAALAARLLSWGGRFNFAEYVTLGLYLMPHSMLLTLPFAPILQASSMAFVAQLLVQAGYVVWGFTTFHTERRLGAALRGVVVYVVYYAVTFVIATVLLFAHIILAGRAQ